MTTTAPKLQVPKLQTPAGACDAHMHIIYPEDIFPFAPGNEGAFPEASLEDYAAVARRIGIERCVMTQAPAYEMDNAWVLAAMAEFGPNARGTVALDPDFDIDDLESLDDLGVRGACFHMLPGGWHEWSEIPGIAEKVAEFGWHLQIQLDGLKLPGRLELLEALPTTIVIDHIGKFHQPVGTDHPSFKALLRLVEGGACYVKLSAPYESTRCGYPYLGDAGGLAKALIKAAPDRMLWASNWPHLGVSDSAEKPDDAVLLDTLLHWTENSAIRDKILRDNPARLYGF